MSRASVAIAILLTPHLALAYRPFSGTDAAVVARSEFELECGIAGTQREGGAPVLTAPALALNFGLAEDWEAILEGRNSLQFDPNSGGLRSNLEDATLLGKFVLRKGVLQQRSGPSVAIEGGVALPAPGKSAGGDLAVSFSTEWEELSLHVNLANEWVAPPARYAPALRIIIEAASSLPTRPVAELSLAVDSATGASSWGVLVGLIHPLSERLALDFSMRGARGDKDFEVSLGLGFTWATEL